MHTYHRNMHKKIRGPDYSRPKGHLCNTIQLFLKFSFKIKYTEHDTSKRSSILWLKIIMVLWKSVMPACHFISPVWWFHYQKKPHPKLWKSNEMAHIQGICFTMNFTFFILITVLILHYSLFRLTLSITPASNHILNSHRYWCWIFFLVFCKAIPTHTV